MRFLKEIWLIVHGLIGLVALGLVSMVIVLCGLAYCAWNLITTGKLWK